VTVKTDDPWTMKRLLEWTTDFLSRRGSEFPRLDAEVLLAHVLDCKRIEVYVRADEEADDDVRQRFRDLVRRRVEGCPVAYLVGRKEFYSLAFEVGPAVLIPRPDSECVVEEVLRQAKGMTEPRVLDLGTGSGNLAVSIAKYQPTAQVMAVDLSPDALAVASRNAAKHGVAERVTFLRGDLFGPVPAAERFDFIVSNPPYILHDEIAGLEPGVRDHEPHLALDGGADGFAVFDRIVKQAKDYLKPGGFLIVEIHALNEEAARTRVLAHPEYELAPTIRDGARNPRVLRARRR
jgi:release factor glutamine methyltransferase